MKHADNQWNNQRCTFGWEHGTTDRCEFYTDFERVSISTSSSQSTSEYGDGILFWPNRDVGFYSKEKIAEYEKKLHRRYPHSDDAREVDRIMNTKGEYRMVEVAIRQRHFVDGKFSTRLSPDLFQACRGKWVSAPVANFF
jgi:hypothetical protein